MKHLFAAGTILLMTFMCFADNDITVDSQPKLKSIATDLNGQPIKLDLNGKPLSKDITSFRGLNYYRSTGNRGDGELLCACNAQFSAGDRVTLLVDGESSLPVGALGTVLCGREYAGEVVLLVEWDNYEDGHNQNDCSGCGEADATNAENRWYVYCFMIDEYITPTGACCINQSCETLSEKDCLAGGGLYQGDNTDCKTSNCGDGELLCACNAQFSAGDRVTLLVDGESSLPVGALGTVLCGREYAGEVVLLVEWDNYEDGHNQNDCSGCGEADATNAENRWYVYCFMIDEYITPTGACCINQSCETLSEKDCLAGGGLYQGDNTDCKTSNCGDGELLCACNAQFSAGDRVTLLVDDQSSLPVGALGTVLCGREYAGEVVLLVEWDNYEDGHNQNDCSGCGEADATNAENRWYVYCDMIAATWSPACLGDLNEDGTVDVDDLLMLIGAWGVCP